MLYGSKQSFCIFKNKANSWVRHEKHIKEYIDACSWFTAGRFQPKPRTQKETKKYFQLFRFLEKERSSPLEFVYWMWLGGVNRLGKIRYGSGFLLQDTILSDFRSWLNNDGPFIKKRQVQYQLAADQVMPTFEPCVKVERGALEGKALSEVKEKAKSQGEKVIAPAANQLMGLRILRELCPLSVEMFEKELTEIKGWI